VTAELDVQLIEQMLADLEDKDCLLTLGAVPK
jgi:hypothetical protein